MTLCCPNTRHGFTLIEMLVVITIIALLISTLLPAIKRAKEMAKLVMCQSNLRQWMLATHTYIGDFTDAMPYPMIEDGQGGSGGGWWAVWYDPGGNGSAGGTSYSFTTPRDHVGYVDDDQGVSCPSVIERAYSNYPGYQFNGNVGTRCWISYDNPDGYYGAPHHIPGRWATSAPLDTSYRDHVIKYSRITEPGMTPLYHDAGGKFIYLSQYGGGSYNIQYGPGNSAEQDFYAENDSDIKFRHKGLANLVMLDGHAESIPGEFLGDRGSSRGAAYDVPQTWDHLYAEGKPYYWHYRREPYRIY